MMLVKKNTARRLPMRKVSHPVLITLSTVTVGCKVERNVVIDFANPMFDLHCGPVSVIAFPNSTVLHIGSTNFMLSLPFYVPLAVLVALFVGLWLMLRRR